MLIPGLLCPNSYGLAQVKRIRDLGSVSTGYSDRPVARAIKIKHAGLNLTGPVLWCLGYLLPSAPKDRLLRAGSKKASPKWKKLQASSFKLDSRSGIV